VTLTPAAYDDAADLGPAVLRTLGIVTVAP